MQFRSLPWFFEWISINEIIFFVILTHSFTQFIRLQKVRLQIQHLSWISQINPCILILLLCWNIPTTMLRINVIQIIRNEPVFFNGINAGQIRVVFVQVPIGLALKSGIVPTFDWTSSEFVTTFTISYPIPRTPLLQES